MQNPVALLSAHNAVDVALEAAPALGVLDVEAEVVLGERIARDRSGGVLQYKVAAAGNHSGADLRDGHHGVVGRRVARVIAIHQDSHRVLSASGAPDGSVERAGHAPGFRIGTVD